MKRNLNSTLLVLLGLSLFFFPGCKKEEPPAPPPGPAAPPKPAPAPQPPVQQQPSSAKPLQRGAQLNFKNRTDPFKPYVVAEPAPVKAAPAAAPKKELLPIQSYEVNKFRVVGIITGLRENKALILDPNGKSYVVQAGMAIGSNEGRITRITSSSIEVVESYKEYKGKMKKRKIVLTLPKKR